MSRLSPIRSGLVTIEIHPEFRKVHRVDRRVLGTTRSLPKFLSRTMLWAQPGPRDSVRYISIRVAPPAVQPEYIGLSQLQKATLELLINIDSIRAAMGMLGMVLINRIWWALLTNQLIAWIGRYRLDSLSWLLVGGRGEHITEDSVLAVSAYQGGRPG